MRDRVLTGLMYSAAFFVGWVSVDVWDLWRGGGSGDA